MKLEELLDVKLLEQHIENKVVNKRKHPTLPLYILNYSVTAQYNWSWDEVTLQCRGLVIDEDNNVIARPFRKFFTIEQLQGDESGEKILQKLYSETYEVQEKLDGSLVIIFKYEGELVTATRGSFESEQAIKAYDLIPEGFTPVEGFTYLFEIIYKQNKIVCDYDFEGLVLLSIINTENGSEHSNFYQTWFKRPKIYSFNSLEEILSYKEPNIEGFIVKFEDGTRIKIKTEDYKRLHRLITGVNEKTVWEALKSDKLEELLENTPDEFYKWVREVKERLEFLYRDLERQAFEYFSSISVNNFTRKDFALAVSTCEFPHKSILFNLYDGKDYSEAIWKLIKPKVENTFKIIREDSN